MNAQTESKLSVLPTQDHIIFTVFQLSLLIFPINCIYTAPNYLHIVILANMSNKPAFLKEHVLKDKRVFFLSLTLSSS